MAKAKFGFFYGSNDKPAQVVQGDEMEMVDNTVRIYAGEERELVAAFCLPADSHVRKIT